LDADIFFGIAFMFDKNGNIQVMTAEFFFQLTLKDQVHEQFIHFFCK